MGELFGLITLAGLIAAIAVNVLFALGVHEDAAERRKTATIYFAGPLTWMFATMLGGVFVAGVYWFIHISRSRDLQAA